MRRAKSWRERYSSSGSWSTNAPMPSCATARVPSLRGGGESRAHACVFSLSSSTRKAGSAWTGASVSASWRRTRESTSGSEVSCERSLSLNESSNQPRLAVFVIPPQRTPKDRPDGLLGKPQEPLNLGQGDQL